MMLDRSAFRRHFHATGPVVLPVIHVLDSPRTAANIEKLLAGGAHGCFLINHDFEAERLIPILRDMRSRFPTLWIGVNFLAVTGKDAFPILGGLAKEGCRVDAYWADDARIDEDGDTTEPEAIARTRAESGWTGLYFGGTAFKKQRAVDPSRYADAATQALPFMDVVTTSGVATGEAADLGKIGTFRHALGDRPLAIASGITPDNAADYAEVDCFMVATGINEPGNFYDIDVTRLIALMERCRALAEGQPHEQNRPGPA
jgi:uncharacterized protein